VHGYIRATEDVDVVVLTRDTADIDAELESQGYVINPEPRRFQGGFNIHRRVRPRGEHHFVVDLLMPPPDSDLFSEFVEAELGGEKVYVVSKGDLIRMKQLAGRERDALDIRELEGLHDDGA
jgi:hypothetical protein